MEAMIREFEEETAVQITDWKPFCTMGGTNNNREKFSVQFFYSITDAERLDFLLTITDEAVGIWPAWNITGGFEKTVGNVPWLVALAKDFGQGVYPPVNVIADYTRL